LYPAYIAATTFLVYYTRSLAPKTTLGRRCSPNLQISIIGFRFIEPCYQYRFKLTVKAVTGILRRQNKGILGIIPLKRLVHPHW
jgi:hypothetical protein